MDDVTRKRIVGAAVLIFIGVMLPLLLSRFLHDPVAADQTMRVYEITPSGGVEQVVADADTSRDTDRAPDLMAMDNAVDSADAEPVADTKAGAPVITAPTPVGSGPTSGTQQSAGAVKSASNSKDVKVQQAPVKRSSLSHDKGLRKAAASGSWVVQVASFAKESNAQQAAKQIADDYAAFYTAAQVNGETWYRVRVGPFDGEADADNAAAKLQAQGHDTLVVHVD